MKRLLVLIGFFIALQAPATIFAASSGDQKTFDDNVYAYPNPVRAGQATFHIQAIRDNASLELKIYTLAGDLVKQQSYSGVAAGNVVTYVWNLSNENGSKVGRGLYYCIARETDSQGVLQTVKKLAVIQ